MAAKDWRVVVEVETDSTDGRRTLRLDLPRDEWTLDELHDIGRGAAAAAGVLTEETTAVDVRVSFPELEEHLLDHLRQWYDAFRSLGFRPPPL
jgi:hypothetical protein